MCQHTKNPFVSSHLSKEAGGDIPVFLTQREQELNIELQEVDVVQMEG